MKKQCKVIFVRELRYYVLAKKMMTICEIMAFFMLEMDNRSFPRHMILFLFRKVQRHTRSPFMWEMKGELPVLKWFKF